MIGHAYATASRLRRTFRVITLKEAGRRRLETLALRALQYRYFDLKISAGPKEMSRKKMKSFAGLPNKSSAIRENLHRNRTGHQTRASTMKTLLTIGLSSLAFALVSLAQAPPPGQAPPATGGTSPAAQAPTNPAAAAQQAPATNLAPGQQPPPPGNRQRPGNPECRGKLRLLGNLPPQVNPERRGQ